jgi:hypothetical protein
LLVAADLSNAATFVTFEPVSSANTTVQFGPTTPASSRTLVAGAAANTLTLRAFIPVPGGTPFVGGTQFDNVAVSLSGLTVKTQAASVGSLIAQSIKEATFTFTDTGTSTVLLTGKLHELISVGDGDGGLVDVDANVLNGIRGSQTGSIQFANVEYTGGTIYNALLAIPGSVAVNGSGVFNLLLPNTQTFGLSTNGGFTSFKPFDARAQGQFLTPVIPEPSSAAGLLVPAAALLTRRRKA